MPLTEVRAYRETDGSVPIRVWLDELEHRDALAFGKCIQRILMLRHSGHELRRPIADLLRDGIYELRIRRGTVNYCILYFFRGQNAVVLSHGLAKEKQAPAREIDTAVQRKTLVEKDPAKYTAELEV